jgi:hypothetical protein
MHRVRHANSSTINSSDGELEQGLYHFPLFAMQVSGAWGWAAACQEPAGDAAQEAANETAAARSEGSAREEVFTVSCWVPGPYSRRPCSPLLVQVSPYRSVSLSAEPAPARSNFA